MTDSPPHAPDTDTDPLRSDPTPGRMALRVRANPGPRQDYVVRLTATLAPRQTDATVPPVRVTLDYVPDRVVLDPDAFVEYVDGLARTPWDGLEALGLAVLDDINNEVVPRWLRVRVSVGTGSRTAAAAGLRRYGVTLTDRQPSWTPDPVQGLGPWDDPVRG